MICGLAAADTEDAEYTVARMETPSVIIGRVPDAKLETTGLDFDLKRWGSGAHAYTGGRPSIGREQGRSVTLGERTGRRPIETELRFRAEPECRGGTAPSCHEQRARQIPARDA